MKMCGRRAAVWSCARVMSRLAGLLLAVCVSTAAVAEKGMQAIGDSTLHLDTTEVTNRQLARFLNEMGNLQVRGVFLVEAKSAYALVEEVDGTYRPKQGYAEHPAVEVSFEGARAYCEWAGKRLPTEKEWQRACEGPEGLTYPWGAHMRVTDPTSRTRANIAGAEDGFEKTAPVASFPAGRSPYGLWDMSGNVWEWTHGTDGKPKLRSGSWAHGRTTAQCGKSHDMYSSHSDVRGNSVGLRCAR